ncbi:MAG: hypothetical protein K2K57_07475 [Oscillospiraceae bacterium]|nr:hypothetical protein [Oscillospiraceae bacterium]
MKLTAFKNQLKKAIGSDFPAYGKEPTINRQKQSPIAPHEKAHYLKNIKKDR